MIVRDTHPSGECRMLLHMLVFPVHRNEKLRFGKAEHHLKLFLAGVPRYMHLIHPLIKHLGAKAHKIVDQA